jgi:flagellar motor component MotA
MITRIFGLILTAGCLGVVFAFENASEASGYFRIFHWPAMVLTGIGPIGLILLCSDWARISGTIHELIQGSGMGEKKKHSAKLHAAEAEYLHQVSLRYYVQGARAFESKSADEFSPYLQKTMRRLATRIPISDVRALLEREEARVEEELQQYISTLSLGVRLAPSVGMLGTILGMVKLLSDLKDPSNIGSHMGLALLTTFYGLFFSLVLWTPLEQSLQTHLSSELRGIEQILHWLELLEHRKPAQYFSDQNVTPLVAPETGVTP